MAKKTTPAPAAKAVTTTSSGTIHLRGIFVTDLEFHEIPSAIVGADPKGHEPMPIQLTLNVVAGMTEAGTESEVRLQAEIVPDPKRRPYTIKVAVVGQFAIEGGTSAELLAFSQQQAPSIIFPYLRQIVDRVTIDARFGVVRLDLVNLQTMFDPAKWQGLASPDASSVTG